MSFASQIRILAMLLVLCSNALADTLKNPAEARKLTDRIMTKVGKGDVEGGIRLSKPFLAIPAAEFDALLDQLKTQQPAMIQRFGKSIGHEFIRQDKAGENLLRIIQLHRFEKHVMRWSFYFYRGKNGGWVLNTFKTDDDIRQLFP